MKQVVEGFIRFSCTCRSCGMTESLLRDVDSIPLLALTLRCTFCSSGQLIADFGSWKKYLG